MDNGICRWGILSTAVIGQKNWQAIQLAENAILSAVASRDLNRSESFIAQCQKAVPFATPPIAVGSYEALLDRDDIDAVYIPLPTGIRKEWVIRAADSGKHVLCEKPCALNSFELQEMVTACARNRVQFMDGVMFMHSSRLQQLRAVIDSGELFGSVRRIYSQFSFLADEAFRSSNIRTDCRLEPFGCLGDLGWYNIRFSLWVMNGLLPKSVRATTITESGKQGSGGSVPIELVAELFFADGVTAGFYCSFEANNQQWANISGTAGQVEISDFVLAYEGSTVHFKLKQPEYRVVDCEFSMREHATVHTIGESANNAIDSQETNMFRRFSAIVLSGRIEEFWPETALKTQLVLDACICSANAGSSLINISEP